MKKKQLLRQKFQLDVFDRDKNCCVFCNHTDNLDAHHITDRKKMPNGGYVIENGITLCPTHHLLAEEYHIHNGEKWHLDMHPVDLYQKIGSSYDKAFQASEKLN